MGDTICEVRCQKCNRLLFTVKSFFQVLMQRLKERVMEVKCQRCKAINKI